MSGSCPLTYKKRVGISQPPTKAEYRDWLTAGLAFLPMFPICVFKPPSHPFKPPKPEYVGFGEFPSTPNLRPLCRGTAPGRSSRPPPPASPALSGGCAAYPEGRGRLGPKTCLVVPDVCKPCLAEINRGLQDKVENRLFLLERGTGEVGQVASWLELVWSCREIVDPQEPGVHISNQ